jgi:hypothetical protein
MLHDCKKCKKQKTDKFRLDLKGEPIGYVCDRCWKGKEGKTIPYEDIWDYCFECGRPLTADMEEDKDWFDIRNAGEAFPVCKSCKEKAGGDDEVKEEIRWKEFNLKNGEPLVAAAIGMAASDRQVLIATDIHEIMAIAYTSPANKVVQWKMPPNRFKEEIESELKELFGGRVVSPKEAVR